jgi:hypothetical protein
MFLANSSYRRISLRLQLSRDLSRSVLLFTLVGLAESLCLQLSRDLGSLVILSALATLARSSTPPTATGRRKRTPEVVFEGKSVTAKPDVERSVNSLPLALAM